jgi:hypothetical protein
MFVPPQDAIRPASRRGRFERTRHLDTKRCTPTKQAKLARSLAKNIAGCDAHAGLCGQNVHFTSSN